MVERVRLIADDCAGARLLARQMESRLFQVNWISREALRDDTSTQNDETLQVLYGGKSLSSLLIDFASSPYAHALPTLLVVANPDWLGAAFISHVGVDDCMCLPITEEGVSLRLRQLALHQRQVTALRAQWPEGLTPTFNEVEGGRDLKIALIEPDRLLANRCQEILCKDGHEVHNLRWDQLVGTDSFDVLLANPGSGPDATENLTLVRAFLESQPTATQFVLLGKANLTRSARRNLQGRAMAAGATAFLDKPFSDLFLTNTISRLAIRVQEVEELSRSLKELRGLGTTDGLTGLRSRGFAERILVHTPGASIAMLDLDNLKVINDQLGHGAGDEALRIIGRALAKHLSAAQVLARWGGDEFLVFDKSEQDLESALVACSLSLPNLTAATSTRPPVRPEFSFGIASCDEAGDLESVLELADSRLYQQKRTKKEGQRPS